MLSIVRRVVVLAPLLVAGCGVTLTSFTAPATAAPGSTITLTVRANVTGTTGLAGCVLQLPIGWNVDSAFNNWNSFMFRDDAAHLANYVAEPDHYLAGFAGAGNISSPQTTLTVTVSIPADAAGPYPVKIALAEVGNSGTWTLVAPQGLSQFAAINSPPYVQVIRVGTQVEFVPSGTGLPTATPAAHWSGTAFGDVDGDGRDDLAAVDASGGGTRFWLAGPGNTWTERSTGLPTTTGPADVAFAHLDNDGLLDLVDGNGQVCFGDGGTGWTLGAALPLTFAANTYRSVAVGDVDGDGLADLAIASGLNGTLQVLHNNGNRTFQDASSGLPSGPAGDEDHDLVLADLDGDGDLDLLWAHWRTPNVWLGNGQGGWTAGTGLPNQLTAAAAGDLDDDGIAEVVVGLDFAGFQVFRHAGGTTWAPAPFSTLPSIQSWAAIALLDYDRDGRIDIAAVNTYRFSLFRRYGSAFYEDPVSSGTFGGGVAQDLASGDFDGNTFPDLVIATGAGTPGSLQTYHNLHTGVAPFAPGCSGGAVAEPQLQWSGVPRRGHSTFFVRIESPTPGATVAFWLGGHRVTTGQGGVPFDLTAFGAPGCTVWCTIDWPLIGQVDAAGHFTVPLAVPNEVALAALTLYGQGAEWAANANPYGVVFTRAAAFRIQ